MFPTIQAELAILDELISQQKRRSEAKLNAGYICICTNYSAIYVSWFNKIRLHFSKLLLKQNCEINSLCLLHFICFSELRTKVRRSNWKISYMHKQIARVERYIDITYILYIYIYIYISIICRVCSLVEKFRKLYPHRTQWAALFVAPTFK